MKINRRNFLKTTLFTSLYFAGFGFPANANFSKKKNLVIIMLRGGMDGLCTLPLKNNSEFDSLRSSINLNQNFNLTSDFNLHPSLKNFHTLWNLSQAAAVHATSIPYTGRSHFDGQNLMETGSKTPYKIKTGWLGRGMNLANLNSRGLALSLPIPLILRGSGQHDNYFPAKGKLPSEKVIKTLKEIYNDSSEKELSSIIDIISQRTSMSNYSEISNDNHSLAIEGGKILKNINGPRVAVFEVNGFDTHASQSDMDGGYQECLDETDKIIKGLKISLGNEFNNTLILTLTEFGRTVNQNNSDGTDHGYGTAILMSGGLIKKSQILTNWPGISKKDRFQGRDLNSTIDARSIYASAMSSVFDIEFGKVKQEVFWGENLQDFSDKLFSS